MSVLSEILQEEYERLNQTIASFEKDLKELPKGTIITKKINGHDYFYLQWREGKKVKSSYIKKEEKEATEQLLDRRKEFQQKLKEMYHSRGEFKKVLGKEL